MHDRPGSIPCGAAGAAGSGREPHATGLRRPWVPPGEEVHTRRTARAGTVVATDASAPRPPPQGGAGSRRRLDANSPPHYDQSMLLSRPLRSLLAAILLATSLAAQGKNLLFYGNSFSYFHGGVAQLVRAMAIEVGLPPPVYQERLPAGQDLRFHATDPGQVAAISNFLPPGQTWDVVIIQGMSTETTIPLGNPAAFQTNALAIVGNVRAHSPAAKVVMYQTWARGQGHSFYPTHFPGPMAMHNQVRAAYRQVVPAINAAFGPNTAVNSAAGECAALLQFDPSIYFVDLHHQAFELTAMAAMCLFTSIYSRLVGDITPTFSPPSPLAAILNSYNVDAGEWAYLTGIADTCAAPALRLHRGSGDYLLLETGNQPNGLTAVAWHPLGLGSLAQMRVTSRNGVYDNAPAVLLATLFPTGQPPLPFGPFPELAAAPGSLSILLSTSTLQTPLSLTVPMPFTLPGASILVQGLALAPSAETGNPLFTTTDGHRFVFQ